MSICVIDGEWSITWKLRRSKTSNKEDVVKDGTPYNPNNKLVSFQYQHKGVKEFLFFHHKHLDFIPVKENFDKLQAVLNDTTLLVGHNLKADLIWLLESGFTLPDNIKFFDTMLFEYFKQKGLKASLSLEDVSKAYGVKPKEDMLGAYFDKGINVDEVPVEELVEYGIGDITTTYELYTKQCEWFKGWKGREYSTPILKVMNEFLPVLVEMERSGVKIDTEALAEVEKEFVEERRLLEAKLTQSIRDAMGDTPINLNSSEQLSWVIYSLKVTDKKKWVEVFNIGTELRNGVKKKKYPTRMTYKQLKETIRALTVPVYRTIAEQCVLCGGTGKIQKIKKDGNPHKNLNNCPACEASGFIYRETNEIAGFQAYPFSSVTASDGGFSASSDTVDELLERDLNPRAREFLSMLSRYNSLTTYLNNFVGGIENNMHDGVLHIPYNNAVTSTGRLSSPFHNIPKGKTFPIKRVFKSRFKGGTLINADASQLEFRVAAMQSKCIHARKSITDKIDIHTHTMNTLTAAGEPTDRDGAKPFTFKPLFGGQNGTEAQKAWFTRFLEWFSGIDKWQKTLGDEALLTKEIRSPSGRIYAFPYTKRFPSGRVSNFTQICNYPVQGFGFDIIMLTMIVLWKEFRKQGIKKTKLIMNVHDSVVLDVPPEELSQVIDIFNQVITGMGDKIISIYHIEDKDVEIPWELQLGENLMELKKLS